MSRQAVIVALLFAVVAAIPFVASGLRSRGAEGSAPRCERDGVELGPVFRVIVETADPASGEVSPAVRHAFCSVRCAEDWRTRTPGAAETVRRVLVTDETTGDEIDARTAWFARSSVVTSRATGERIHAFRDESDAKAHLDAYGGRMLVGDERPLAVPGRRVPGGARNGNRGTHPAGSTARGARAEARTTGEV